MNQPVYIFWAIGFFLGVGMGFDIVQRVIAVPPSTAFLVNTGIYIICGFLCIYGSGLVIRVNRKLHA